MKKLIVVVILTALAAASCEDIPSEIIDKKFSEYFISDVNAPDTLVYNSPDSTLTTSLQIENAQNIAEVNFDLLSADGSQTLASNIVMSDDGNTSVTGDTQANDNIYTGKFVISNSNPVGTYEINYYVKDLINDVPNNIQKVASHLFYFSKGKPNVAPQISNVTMPDSVQLEQFFTFTVKAEDANGLSDIEVVNFRLQRPDGSYVTNNSGSRDFAMHDDGDSNYGDQTANDGIYSFRNKFSNAQKGTWKFEFEAQDRSGALSNILTQNIELY